MVSSNGNSVAQKFGFNGQEYEEALGFDMYEMDFRGYDPALGRFFAIDPLTEVIPAINPYQFSFNNPIFLADPTGLIPQGMSTEDFIQDLWNRTPDDGYAYSYDSGGNLTGVTDPDEIAIAETQYNNGITKTNNKKKRAYFVQIDREYNYLRARGMREEANFLQDLIQNGNLTPQEIAEVAQLRKTLVSKLKATYMMAIFSPDIVSEVLFMGAIGSASNQVRNKTFNYIARGQQSRAGITVLGKFPEYLQLAEKLGANKFSIPMKIWNKMTPVQQWAANTKFLDRAIQRGDKILLAQRVTNLKNVTGFLRKELNYLMERGYKLNKHGTSLIKSVK